MKRPGLIIAICLLALHASAQFNLEFHSGYGKYSLAEIKNYQKGIMSSYPSGAAITESFPAFWYYGVDAKWNFGGAQLGLSISNGSSGGQVYYRDYSGFARERELFTYTAVRAITAKKWSLADGKFVLSVDPGFGIASGKMVVTRNLHVEGGSQPVTNNSTDTYKSLNVFLEPTISLSRRFGPVGITAFAGYHLDMTNSEFRGKHAEPLSANTISTRAAVMNLSGYRVGGSVGFYVSRKTPADFTRFYFGPGIGLDYGGIGLNAMIMATEQFGFFAGAGYNFNNVGVNGGVRAYLKKQSSRVRPYFSGMYGYNSVVVITDIKYYSKTFYGPSVGFGFDVMRGHSNFSTLAVHLPIRGNDVHEYIDYLKSQGAKFEHALLPLTVSVGFRLARN